MQHNKSLEAAQVRAINAMQTLSEKKIQKLPLLDCAYILSSLPHDARLSTVRRLLAMRLCSHLTTTWIENGNGYEVFSVLVALLEYDSKLVTGEHLASTVRRLIASEMAVGGPYRTEGTIAIATNARIARFMQLVAKPLPNIEAFLDDAVTAQHFDKTELSRPCLLLLLAQAGQRPKLTQYVARRWQQDDWQSPQHIVAALTVLKGDERQPQVQRALATLFKRQLPTGFWEGEPILQTKPPVANSRFATTALVAGVLADYQHNRSNMTSPGLKHRRHDIAHAARQTCNSYSEPLRSSALAMVRQACNADKNFEITLLPYFFAQALETPVVLSEQQQILLGSASLYGWIAYTIYDNFLDGEGKPVELPVANTAMRASLNCFRVAFPGQSFQRYVNDVFTTMEEANAWEVKRCRFIVHADAITIAGLPHYGAGTKLAQRSFAHALAPMAILTQQSSCAKTLTQRIESAFRHYLIARQLNDDMRDWPQDIRVGQASYVVTAILRDMGIKQGVYSLSTLLPTMQKRFRKKTMSKICKQILRHTAMSRQAFAKSHLMRDTNNIYLLLDSIEWSVRQSLEDQSKARAFDNNADNWG